MSTSVSARGAQDLPAWVRRSWTVPLALGLLSAFVGVVLLINIGAGVTTLRWLLVVALVLAALSAFATTSTRRWHGRLVGALYLLGAVVTIFWPEVTVRALALTIGVSLLVAGAVQAVSSWRTKEEARSWGWGFALGLLSVLGGLVLVFGNPLISVVLLVVVLACYLISTGVTLLLIALVVRRLTAAVGRAASR